MFSYEEIRPSSLNTDTQGLQKTINCLRAFNHPINMSCDGFKYPEVVNPQIIHSKKIDFWLKHIFPSTKLKRMCVWFRSALHLKGFYERGSFSSKLFDKI